MRYVGNTGALRQGTVFTVNDTNQSVSQSIKTHSLTQAFQKARTNTERRWKVGKAMRSTINAERFFFPCLLLQTSVTKETRKEDTVPHITSCTE
jgi:hypothetical protein